MVCRRISTCFALFLVATMFVGTGCEKGTLIDEEMWRINFILEQNRSEGFEKRMKETYERSQKLLEKVREVRADAVTWEEEIDSLRTKIVFLEKSRKPLTDETARWEDEREGFLMKAVEFKSKSEEARSQLTAVIDEYERIKEEIGSLPEEKKTKVEEWGRIKETIETLKGQITDGVQEIERLNTENADTQAALENVRKSATSAQQELQDLQEAMSSSSSLKAKIEEVRDAIKRLAGEKMDLEGRKIDLGGEVEKLKEDMKPIVENNALIKQMSQDLAEETQKIRGESNRLLQEKGELEAQTAQLESDIAKLEEEIDNLKKKKREREEERDGLQD